MNAQSAEHDELDCRAAMRRLYDFLDRELTEREMQAVRAHLERCRPCFAHAAFERDLLTSLRGSWKDIVASPALKQRIQDQLRQAGFGR